MNTNTETTTNHNDINDTNLEPLEVMKVAKTFGFRKMTEAEMRKNHLPQRYSAHTAYSFNDELFVIARKQDTIVLTTIEFGKQGSRQVNAVRRYESMTPAYRIARDIINGVLEVK